MPQPLLSIRDLRVRFAIHGTTLEAVRGVSFDIMPGATVALVGESGSGKSVIARAIMGLLPDNATVTAGQILFSCPQKGVDTVDTVALDPRGRAMRDLRGGSFSLIFQEPMVSLSALHTIGDQISEALFLHRDVGRAEGMELTREMLEIVGFPHPRQALNRYPFELSGGMRQRAMIAMALICHPALLIADEPTTALDVTIQAQILKLIAKLQTQLGMAVLMITHDLGVVANVAREVVVLYHGEVMERGAAQRIFTAAQHPYTRALLAAVPHFSMAADERLTPLREIKTDVGEFFRGKKRDGDSKTESNNGDGVDSKTEFDAQPAQPTIPILRVREVCRSFGARSQAWSLGAPAVAVRAVDRVSFDLMRGECLGLVGESGSGKSTLGKLIARAIEVDSGHIEYIDGDGDGDGDDDGNAKTESVESLGEAQLFNYRCKVQYIFQDPVGSLNPSMTLFDIIREPMEIHRLGGHDYQVETCSELMRLVGLDPRHLRRYPHSFSGGQRQRIGIARALALQPDLLICDEPVSALDVSIQAQVLNLMKDLQRELALSYLFISHNLAVVNYIAARIAVMYRGQFVELAPRESLFANPTHPYTRSLLDAVPVADLDNLLDFDNIAEPRGDSGNGAAASNWHPPFTESPDGPATQLFEIAPGHLVRASANPNAP
ncbi:MAG: ABC transporter ATP-binding protein [Gammaproteobacteria bacterium]|nr:ABC transporter ATP-binding protein [Gammaproteobacteria bacterium]